MKKIEAAYDAVLKRWRATCPTCGYQAVRAKREAAEHVITSHCAYLDHGREG